MAGIIRRKASSYVEPIPVRTPKAQDAKRSKYGFAVAGDGGKDRMTWPRKPRLVKVTLPKFNLPE